MKKGKKERSTNCKRSAVLGKTAVRGIVLFAAVLLLCFIVNVPSKAEGKIIKVGAIAGNSFIENTDGVYHGYGVEYLEEIATYTGWEYEYVFDTWDNCKLYTYKKKGIKFKGVSNEDELIESNEDSIKNQEYKELES